MKLFVVVIGETVVAVVTTATAKMAVYTLLWLYIGLHGAYLCGSLCVALLCIIFIGHTV